MLAPLATVISTLSMPATGLFGVTVTPEPLGMATKAQPLRVVSYAPEECPVGRSTKPTASRCRIGPGRSLVRVTGR